MDKGRFQEKHPLIISSIVLFAFIYMFFYQWAYPFNSAIFLYITFGLCILLIVMTGKMMLNKQLLFMLFIVIVSAIGILYTSNSSGGFRETIIFGVMLVFMVANSDSSALNHKLDTAINFGATLMLIGIYAQFILKDLFNSWMQALLRNDCFDQLMRSYTVDGAYAGFSAYTVDAAFFSAIIFGVYAMRLFGMTERKKSNGIFSVVMICLSLFAVFLTSKRGILVGMLVALFFTMIIMRKISRNMVIKIVIAVVSLIAIIVGLYFASEEAKRFLDRFLITGDISTGRIEMYLLAMDELFSGNFIFGFGTGATYDLYSAGLHNIYLQLLYDHGFLGVIPYLIFFAYNLVLAYRAKNSRSLYIQIMILVYGVFGNPIYSNMIFLTYLIQVSNLNQGISLQPSKNLKDAKIV